jgi:hypothetical protein
VKREEWFSSLFCVFVDAEVGGGGDRMDWDVVGSEGKSSDTSVIDPRK